MNLINFDPKGIQLGKYSFAANWFCVDISSEPRILKGFLDRKFQSR